MKLVIDIGGTSIRSAIFDNDKIVSQEKHSSRGKQLDLMIADLIRSSSVNSVAVSFAGQVSDGVIKSSPNIDLGQLKDKNFNDWTKENFGITGKIDNDLLCVALAEQEQEKSQNMAIFYIGTGFGGAFITDGVLLKGANNLAGEIGHIPYKQAPFGCGCGKSDCVELFCSGKAIELWCEHYGVEKIELDLMKESPKHNQIYNIFIDALSHTISTTIAMLNPELIILGGGVGKNSKLIVDEAKEAVKASFKPAQSVVIKQSVLDDNANLIGANKL